MLRPTWYHFNDLKNGTVMGVWAIGNAFIWWLSVPALGYVGYLAWRDRLKSLGLITLMGFGLWLMWGVQPRPLLYMHYMFETIPFACIALAYIGYQLWNGESEGARAADVTIPAAATGESATVFSGAIPGETQSPLTPAPATTVEAPAPVASPLMSVKSQRRLVIVYGSMIVAWFIFYYPLLAAWPIPWDYYNAHIWFSRAWI